MTAIPIIYVIAIKDVFTSNLTTDIDNKLEKELFDLPYEEIIVDFSGVSTISPDFANRYISNKSKREKTIHEVNIPIFIQNMFENIVV